MKKSVGCFTDEKLKELSSQPNTVVMQPTHDVVFNPWQSSRVSETMDKIVKITLERNAQPEEEIQAYCKKQPDLCDFAQKYQVMFKKLTCPEFVKDGENLKIMKRMILLRAAVDNNMTTAQAAQAEASDIALKSLASRVKGKQ